MHILVIGATGFLGSAIHGALIDAGHSVLATYHRGLPPPDRRETQWQYCDMGAMTVSAWTALLRDVDAVVNCAGVLQDNAWDSTSIVHAIGLIPLLEACSDAQLFRFIHFSAIGADRQQSSAFSRSKWEGEKLVEASPIAWVILRPSVVIGDAAFGGSALFRGLAALPVLPEMPGTAPLQIVQRADVVRTVLHFLSLDSHPRRALDLVGLEVVGMSDVVAIYRRWLGWRPAPRVRVPKWLAQLLYCLGDGARSLGWRPPLGSTARLEMKHGATGNPDPWRSVTGIVPARLADELVPRGASVQERWFAALYLLKPFGFTIFSLFWISTGIISLTVGFQTGLSLLHEARLDRFAPAIVISGALLDIAIGGAIAVRSSTRQGLYAAACVTVSYAAAGSLLIPRLWADPLAPLLKIFPLLVLNLVLLAILEER